jgi:peptidoglycan/xylan/chitin deacetylase (PgdA/CDA1 family)
MQPATKWLTVLVMLLAVALSSGPVLAQDSGIHLPPPEGSWTVYLSFDDGPSSSVTPQILDILAEYHIHATFFLHGSRIKGNEALVKRMIREGHAVGNHLWAQDGYTNGSGATDEQLRATWQRTENEINRALGPALAVRYHQQPVYLIRQPGGAAHPFPVPDGVQAITYNWQVSGGDSIPWVPGPDDPPERPWNYVAANVLLSWYTPYRYYSVYDYGDGTFILMHDVIPVVAGALPYIIEDLQANGASFGVLPRPGDEPGTMPIVLSAPPEWYK